MKNSRQDQGRRPFVGRRVATFVSAAVVAGVAGRVVAVTPPPVSAAWLPDADGDWANPSNWSGGVAPGFIGPTDPGFDDVAQFTAALTAPRTVTLNGTATVGTLQFDSANPYTLAGNGLLTLQGSQPTAGVSTSAIAVTASNGAAFQVIDMPLKLNSQLNLSVAPSTGLELGGVVTLGSRPINVTGGGTFCLNVAAGSTFGGSTVFNVTGSTLEVSNANLFSTASANAGYLNARNAIVRLADGTRLLSAAATNGLTVDVPAGVVSIGALSGDAFTKTGDGALNITSAVDSRFVANMTLSGGELLYQGATAMMSGALTLNRGIIAVDSGAANFLSAKQIVVNGDVQTGDAAHPGTMGLTGTVVLGTTQTQYTLTTPSANNSVIYESNFTDNGQDRGVTFAGPGTVYLEGPTGVGSSFTGPTIVAGGTVLAQPKAISDALIIGSAPGGSAAMFKPLGVDSLDAATDLTVNATGTLNLNGLSQNIRSIAGGGTILLNAGSNGTSITTLAVTGSNSTAFTGVISGTGQVLKTGSGALTLGGASTFNGAPAGNFSNDYGGTFNGGFTLAAGSIALASNTALGPDRLIIADASNTTALSAFGGPRSFTNGVSVSRYATFTGSNAMSFGLLRLQPTGTYPIQLTVDADTTFNGPLLADAGESALIKSGTATLTLNLQRYSGITGPFTLNGGTVRFNSFPATGGFSQFNLNGATLDFSNAGTNVSTTSNITGTDGVVLGALTLLNPAAVGGTRMTFGDLAFEPVARAGPSFLSGSLTTGAIRVDGSLNASGAIAGAGDVLINAGGTMTLSGALAKSVTALGHLAGSGTIGGRVTLTGSAASLALSGASLRTADFTMSGGAAFAPAFSGTNARRLVVAGAVDLGSDDLLLPTGAFGAAPTNQVYVLIDNDGTDPIAGRFQNAADDGDTVTFHGPLADYTAAISYHYDADGDGADNDVALTYLASTPTPEPAACAGFALAFLLARRRRARGPA